MVTKLHCSVKGYDHTPCDFTRIKTIPLKSSTGGEKPTKKFAKSHCVCPHPNVFYYNPTNSPIDTYLFSFDIQLDFEIKI